MEKFVKNKQDVNNLPGGPNGELSLEELDQVGAYPYAQKNQEDQKDLDEMTLEELYDVRAGLTKESLDDMHR